MPRSIFISFLAALAACGVMSRPSAPGSGANALTGTWRLVDFSDWDAAGNLRQVYGPAPVGYVVYDATGHLSVHIMRTPPAPPFAAGPGEPTEAELRGAFDAYVGYFGTPSPRRGPVADSSSRLRRYAFGSCPDAAASSSTALSTAKTVWEWAAPRQNPRGTAEETGV
jgi:hypothetical protein